MFATVSNKLHEWFIRRRLHLKCIQRLAESMIACLPPTSHIRMYLKNQLDTCVFWMKTMNFRVLQNRKKNAPYKVFEIENFLSSEACDTIVRIAKEKGICDSTIIDNRGMHVLDLYTRKSKQGWLKLEDHPIVKSVSEDVSHLTNLPVSHQEQLQVVVYHSSGYYRHHYDASFHPDVITNMNKGCGPRLYTVLIYLNDDFEGGETEFEEMGVRIRPQKGKAILFQNIDDRLDLIPESFHAGLPVSRGTKWVANKWVRIWPMDLQHYMREDAFKNKPTQKPSSWITQARFLLDFYTFRQWQWFHYVCTNPETYWSAKLDILKWTCWNTWMVYNTFCMPPPTMHSSNGKQRIAILEMGPILSEEACQRLIVSGCTHGIDGINDIDEMLTNNLLQCILLPVENDRDYVSALKMTHRGVTLGSFGKHHKGDVISPYSSLDPPPALQNTSTFGLCMASLYIFLNEEPEFEGGAFDFSYVQTFVRPKRGHAVLCLHLNESMAFDCLTFCYQHPVKKGHQWIAEKHIRVLPMAYQSALQDTDAWIQHVKATLQNKYVNIKIT